MGLKVLESYFPFYFFNGKIYFLSQNNSISKKIFLNSVLNIVWAFHFHSYNNVTNTH